MPDPDMVIAPARAKRRCDQCGEAGPRVFMGMGCIFIKETGEGAACVCLVCIKAAAKMLKDSR